MIAGFKLDPAMAPILEDEIVEDLLKIVNVGDKGTFGEDSAYRVNRIEIRLFGESESDLYIDRFIEVGDSSEGNTILVKACQGTDDDKPGDFYVTASIQIFLTAVDESSFTMVADSEVIRSGESTRISLEMNRAGCPEINKSVELRKEGPGSLPESAVTDEEGRAAAEFGAGEKGETKIEALYEDLSTEILITTLPRLVWDLDCSVYAWRYDPDFPRAGWNDDHWRSQVKFVDVPLTELAEADFTVGYDDSIDDPETIQLYMKWLSIPKVFESQGSFYDSRFTVYDGADLYFGTANANPIWILGIGADGERLSYGDENEEEGFKMYLLFKLQRDSIMVSIDEKSGVKTPWFERFERRLRFPRNEILLGDPFTINYEDTGTAIIHQDVEIHFTPKEVGAEEKAGAP